MKSAVYFFLFAASVMSVAAAGCSDGGARMKRSEIKATVDSLVSLQLPDLAQKSDEDLSYRMTIEVKQKADSIANARLKGTPDTTSRK